MVSAMVVAAAATSDPHVYWYATRGLGATTLVVLTATVVLGILSATRWSGAATPGFVAVDLHRNLSLVGMMLLLGHIVTTVLDPYAHISVRDVLIPMGAAYRPVWLGLGVVAFWILIGLIATSLMRDRVGLRTWRVIHWAAYATWPLAVIHGIGTGSDARAPWMVALVAACSAAVAVAIADRLRDGRLITLPVRVLAAVGGIVFIIGSLAWAVQGPLRPGWAARAGTPPGPSVAVAPGPVHPGPAGFSDPLVGVLVKDKTGLVQISLRDTVDTGLTIAIRSPNADETLPVVTIARDGQTLCTVPATAGTTLYAVCRDVRLTVSLYGPPSVLDSGGQITGRLETSGPLN